MSNEATARLDRWYNWVGDFSTTSDQENTISILWSKGLEPPDKKIDGFWPDWDKRIK
jgi:hypothetical protein